MKLKKISFDLNTISDYNVGFKYSTLYLYNDCSKRIRTRIAHEFSYRFNKHKPKIVSMILNGKIPT